eukprot:UN03634
MTKNHTIGKNYPLIFFVNIFKIMLFHMNMTIFMREDHSFFSINTSEYNFFIQFHIFPWITQCSPPPPISS